MKQRRIYDSISRAVKHLQYYDFDIVADELGKRNAYTSQVSKTPVTTCHM